MTKKGEKKHKHKILWVIIVLITMITGVFLVDLTPSLNESASTENTIQETPIDRPTKIVVTSWYLYPHVDIADGGFITKDPCGPPCFWNITPGKTTVSEVYEIIEEKGIAEWCEPYPHSIYCGSTFGLIFYEQGDIVSFIFLSPTQELVMRDIIDKWGTPDRVFTEVGELPDYPDSLDMWIFYDEILTGIRLETQSITDESWHYQVSESSIVDTIEYYDGEGYENNTLYRHASPWHGYGEYLGEWFPSP